MKSKLPVPQVAFILAWRVVVLKMAMLFFLITGLFRTLFRPGLGIVNYSLLWHMLNMLIMLSSSASGHLLLRHLAASSAGDEMVDIAGPVLLVATCLAALSMLPGMS